MPRCFAALVGRAGLAPLTWAATLVWFGLPRWCWAVRWFGHADVGCHAGLVWDAALVLGGALEGSAVLLSRVCCMLAQDPLCCCAGRAVCLRGIRGVAALVGLCARRCGMCSVAALGGMWAGVDLGCVHVLVWQCACGGWAVLTCALCWLGAVLLPA